MYDRETQSWWQQALGEGIVGEMTGVQLTQMPTWMESWAEFRDRNPGRRGDGPAKLAAALWCEPLYQLR